MRGVSNLALVLPPLVLLVEVVVAWLLATAEVVKMKISYPQEKQVLDLRVERKVQRVSSRMKLEEPKVKRKTSIEKSYRMLS